MQCFSSSPLDSRAAHIGESLPALWDKAFGEPEDWDRYSCEDETSFYFNIQFQTNVVF